jgi:hypothetical protein
MMPKTHRALARNHALWAGRPLKGTGDPRDLRVVAMVDADYKLDTVAARIISSRQRS